MGLDAERAKHIKYSPDWIEMSKEIDVLIANQVSLLRSCTASTLPLIQERIKALESIKSLPQDIIDREEGEQPTEADRYPAQGA